MAAAVSDAAGTFDSMLRAVTSPGSYDDRSSSGHGRPCVSLPPPPPPPRVDYNVNASTNDLHSYPDEMCFACQLSSSSASLPCAAQDSSALAVSAAKFVVDYAEVDPVGFGWADLEHKFKLIALRPFLAHPFLLSPAVCRCPCRVSSTRSVVHRLDLEPEAFVVPGPTGESLFAYVLRHWLTNFGGVRRQINWQRFLEVGDLKLLSNNKQSSATPTTTAVAPDHGPTVVAASSGGPIAAETSSRQSVASTPVSTDVVSTAAVLNNERLSRNYENFAVACKIALRALRRRLVDRPPPSNDHRARYFAALLKNDVSVDDVRLLCTVLYEFVCLSEQWRRVGAVGGGVAVPGRRLRRRGRGAASVRSDHDRLLSIELARTTRAYAIERVNSLYRLFHYHSGFSMMRDWLFIRNIMSEDFHGQLKTIRRQQTLHRGRCAPLQLPQKRHLARDDDGDESDQDDDCDPSAAPPPATVEHAAMFVVRELYGHTLVLSLHDLVMRYMLRKYLSTRSHFRRNVHPYADDHSLELDLDMCHFLVFLANRALVNDIAFDFRLDQSCIERADFWRLVLAHCASVAPMSFVAQVYTFVAPLHRGHSEISAHDVLDYVDWLCACEPWYMCYSVSLVERMRVLDERTLRKSLALLYDSECVLFYLLLENLTPSRADRAHAIRSSEVMLRFADATEVAASRCAAAAERGPGASADAHDDDDDDGTAAAAVAATVAPLEPVFNWRTTFESLYDCSVYHGTLSHVARLVRAFFRYVLGGSLFDTDGQSGVPADTMDRIAIELKSRKKKRNGGAADDDLDEEAAAGAADGSSGRRRNGGGGPSRRGAEYEVGGLSSSGVALTLQVDFERTNCAKYTFYSSLLQRLYNFLNHTCLLHNGCLANAAYADSMQTLSQKDLLAFVKQEQRVWTKDPVLCLYDSIFANFDPDSFVQSCARPRMTSRPGKIIGNNMASVPTSDVNLSFLRVASCGSGQHVLMNVAIRRYEPAAPSLLYLLTLDTRNWNLTDHEAFPSRSDPIISGYVSNVLNELECFVDAARQLDTVSMILYSRLIAEKHVGDSSSLHLDADARQFSGRIDRHMHDFPVATVALDGEEPDVAAAAADRDGRDRSGMAQNGGGGKASTNDYVDFVIDRDEFFRLARDLPVQWVARFVRRLVVAAAETSSRGDGEGCSRPPRLFLHWLLLLQQMEDEFGYEEHVARDSFAERLVDAVLEVATRAPHASVPVSGSSRKRPSLLPPLGSRPRRRPLRDDVSSAAPSTKKDDDDDDDEEEKEVESGAQEEDEEDEADEEFAGQLPDLPLTRLLGAQLGRTVRLSSTGGCADDDDDDDDDGGFDEDDGVKGAVGGGDAEATTASRSDGDVGGARPNDDASRPPTCSSPATGFQLYGRRHPSRHANGGADVASSSSSSTSRGGASAARRRPCSRRGGGDGSTAASSAAGGYLDTLLRERKFFVRLRRLLHDPDFLRWSVEHIDGDDDGGRSSSATPAVRPVGADAPARWGLAECLLMDERLLRHAFVAYVYVVRLFVLNPMPQLEDKSASAIMSAIGLSAGRPGLARALHAMAQSCMDDLTAAFPCRFVTSLKSLHIATAMTRWLEERRASDEASSARVVRRLVSDTAHRNGGGAAAAGNPTTEAAQQAANDSGATAFDALMSTLLMATTSTTSPSATTTTTTASASPTESVSASTTVGVTPARNLPRVHSNVDHQFHLPVAVRESIVYFVVVLYIFCDLDMAVVLYMIRLLLSFHYPGVDSRSCVIVRGSSGCGKSEFFSMIRDYYNCSAGGVLSTQTLASGRNAINTEVLPVGENLLCQIDEPKRVDNETFKLLISTTALPSRSFLNQTAQGVPILARLVITLNHMFQIESDDGVLERLRCVFRLAHKHYDLVAPQTDMTRYNCGAAWNIAHQFSERVFPKDVDRATFNRGMFHVLTHWGCRQVTRSEAHFASADLRSAQRLRVLLATRPCFVDKSSQAMRLSGGCAGAGRDAHNRRDLLLARRRVDLVQQAHDRWVAACDRTDTAELQQLPPRPDRGGHDDGSAALALVTRVCRALGRGFDLSRQRSLVCRTLIRCNPSACTRDLLSRFVLARVLALSPPSSPLGSVDPAWTTSGGARFGGPDQRDPGHALRAFLGTSYARLARRFVFFMADTDFASRVIEDERTRSSLKDSLGKLNEPDKLIALLSPDSAVAYVDRSGGGGVVVGGAEDERAAAPQAVPHRPLGDDSRPDRGDAAAGQAAAAPDDEDDGDGGGRWCRIDDVSDDLPSESPDPHVAGDYEDGGGTVAAHEPEQQNNDHDDDDDDEDEDETRLIGSEASRMLRQYRWRLLDTDALTFSTGRDANAQKTSMNVDLSLLPPTLDLHLLDLHSSVDAFVRFKRMHAIVYHEQPISDDALRKHLAAFVDEVNARIDDAKYRVKLKDFYDRFETEYGKLRYVDPTTNRVSPHLWCVRLRRHAYL